MRTLFLSVVLVAELVLHFTCVAATEDGPIAWWKFDEGEERIVTDSVSGAEDEILGFFKYVEGASGDALRFDGYSTAVRRKAKSAPEPGNAFSIEAWVAFQAYPWGSCAIVSQCDGYEDVVFRRVSSDYPPETDPNAGYYFAVDPRGRVQLQVSVDGEWTKCQSEARIPLLEWAHIAGTYNGREGLAVYVNGKEAGSTPARGRVKFAPEIDMLVGRNHKPRRVEYTVGSIVPSVYSFDGYLDEVKIHDRALAPGEIAQVYEATKPSGGTGMAFRKLPTEPRGPAPFGAYYTNLKFDETWDALRREGAHPDVVVLFDDMPWRFVFWRGTGYIPFWVTENDIWYTNEFNETWPPVDAPNVYEPMSDKHARYSHVRIIESHDARVVIHWRYALSNTLNEIAWEDPLTGWGDWADEYDYIYPDGACVRKQKVWSSQIDQAHEFQESIILEQPGQRPEDVLELGGYTISNMSGETHTYSWADGPPQAPTMPGAEDPMGAQLAFLASMSYPNIQLVNTKSKAKPFLIVTDEAFESAWPLNMDVGGPVHVPYDRLIQPEASKFTWWNHWPVAQVPSDGRWTFEPDRVAHTAVSNWFWKPYERTADMEVKLALLGLTEKKVEELVPLAKSWLRAPALELKGSGYTSKGYDQAERAYLITCENSNEPAPLQFALAASEEHPVVNPAFVISGWGDAGAALKIGGETVKRGASFRFGHRTEPTRTDLIVWLKLESAKPVEIALEPLAR